MATPQPMHLPDAEALCAQLAERLRPALSASSAMIGIHTGGAWLAERLHAALGLQAPLGLMDISFYRDDYASDGGRWQFAARRYASLARHTDAGGTTVAFDLPAD